MISYQTNLNNITPEKLNGFFVGWPNHPTPEKHLEILKNSSHIVLAIDTESGNVIGFINAVSDNTLSAYIPLLEVLPEYQLQGIGTELVNRLLDQLADFYMIDLACDPDKTAFYKKCGFKPMTSMVIRNYACQSGTKA